jgi:hypothetical protein
LIQILDCVGLAAADVGGTSDPYVAVTYKERLAGFTRTKVRSAHTLWVALFLPDNAAPADVFWWQYMTINPRWSNQTFVLPLDANLYEALMTVLYSPDHDERRGIIEKYKIKVSLGDVVSPISPGCALARPILWARRLMLVVLLSCVAHPPPPARR